MERKVYLLNELPTELRAEVELATFRMGMDIMRSVGFTRDGVRYRIYRSQKTKDSMKAQGLVDLLDALKGADVPVEDVEVAMDNLGLDAEKRKMYWAGIAEAESHQGLKC